MRELARIAPKSIRFETDADEGFATKYGNDVGEIVRKLQDVEKLWQDACGR